MSTYFGGRAEVRHRKAVCEVVLADFKSMYPTVNALMGLWQFICADGYSCSDTTSSTQDLLAHVGLSDLRHPAFWPCLATLVKLRPNHDCLPLRTNYTEAKPTLTIGLNHISSDNALWYTLADVIASKLLTGKVPVIEQALTYKPGPHQDTLKSFDLFGNPSLRIDPLRDDLFRKLIDLRDGAKARKDPIQQQLKILANSTCYGILVEVIRDDAPKPDPLRVFGPNKRCSEVRSCAIEKPGKYFHPLLATLITGAARLMLAITERLASDAGLGWAFCDTDSMALTRPGTMQRDDFVASVHAIVDWFLPLNPYQKPGSILKIEDVNFEPDTQEHQPLFCYAISAKRYVLFNLDESGNPVIRKASAHGLGHLMPPYTEREETELLTMPVYAIADLGVNLWQHDVWFCILKAALAGRPNQVEYTFDEALRKPALQRYGATSPRLLDWMKHFNAGKTYQHSIKPFGFLVSLMARSGPFVQDMPMSFIKPEKRGRPRKNDEPKPVSPFERDSQKAAEIAFDRVTGKPVPIESLKTYAEALALYHLSPEDKFENGGPWDTGPTLRRHLIVKAVQLIGKEANKVGEAGQPDPTTPAVAHFSMT